MTTKKNTTFVDQPSERHTFGTVTTVRNSQEAVSLLIPHSKSTLNDKKTAVRIANAT